MSRRKKNENLVIVFVKNMVEGKVKTRLAKSIGNEAACGVYADLLRITEKATEGIAAEVWVYYSDAVDGTMWHRANKKVQNGKDLGEKMLNAFSDGFSLGYENILLIGSDLPEMSSNIIDETFYQLRNKQVVFGPAEDGGYYLVGLSVLHTEIFEHKPWSEAHLLSITLQELKEKEVEVSLLDTLNDIDTYEDLVNSTIYDRYSDTITLI